MVVARAGDGQATAQQAQRQQPLLGGFEPLGLLPARQLERQVEIVEPTHDSSLSSEPLPPHRPVDPSPSFPRLEEAVLERWRERDVFRESLRRREGADRFVFYEGPPTVNGPPGVHHVLARVFKDIFPATRPCAATTSSARAATTATACRWSCGREGDRLDRQGRHRALRHRGLQRPLPRVGHVPHLGLEPPDRADRVLGRPRRRLPDHGPRLRGVGVVGAEVAVGRGPALRGPQGRALLPALRHGAVQPRARPARRVPRHRRPVAVRALPGGRTARAAAARRRAAGLDDHAVDAGLARRHRHRPGPALRARPRSGHRERRGAGRGPRGGAAG